MNAESIWRIASAFLPAFITAPCALVIGLAQETNTQRCMVPDVRSPLGCAEYETYNSTMAGLTGQSTAAYLAADPYLIGVLVIVVVAIVWAVRSLSQSSQTGTPGM